jgi:KDO2-lipid IV(A) lauroyltransferase
MAMMAMELLFTPRLITPWTWSKYIRVGPEITAPIRYLLENKSGVIMVTGHYGNWELIGYAMACVGFDIAAVMRPLDNPYLNDYTVRTRAAGGLKLIYKKGMTEIAEEVLQKGGSVGFIADQNAGHKGLFVDFFGRKASTYKSIGLLAREYNVPIMIGCARRISNNLQYEMDITRIIWPHEWQGKENEVLWITQEYTKAIETFVRKDPSQYLWVHRRWKTRPAGEVDDKVTR